MRPCPVPWEISKILDNVPEKSTRAFDPFLNTAMHMQRFTCNLYYRFDALLAPASVGIITGKHYAKNSVTKLNDRNCDPAKSRNCNQTEEPSEN